MKNSLSDLYEKILLSEAQKNDLTSPSNIVVGDLKSNEEVFGARPEIQKGPEKAKLAQGPNYKISTSSETAPTHGSALKAKFKGTAPAKEEKYDDEVEEMEDEEVIPESEFDEEESPKPQIKKENYNMSAFETLFKKTLLEQADELPEMEAPAEMEQSDEDLDLESEVETEEAPEEPEEESDEESEDLVADLKDLQARLGAILDKLENYSSEEEEGEEEEGSYSEEDFDEEFEEEAPVKESLDKPKLLSPSKGKSLMSKKNKVGKLAPKGGKASAGKFKTQASFKAAPKLQKSKAEVKSTVKKGDFIK